MARYLDPKADLTFKKVFGEHPNLVASLLNALLPLPAGEAIADVEYMSPERVPRTSIGKNSIVDVFCRTGDGRQFIVEMQMCWSNKFMARVLFNSAKVYVDQLGRSDDFSQLRPVYSLNLVDSVFERGLPEFIHHYRIVHDKYTDKVIEGFHLVFVELPKFRPQSIAERRMAVLWLRFLTEVGKANGEIPPELLENEDIRQAVELVDESSYTRGQLMGLDLFWDGVRVEKTLMNERDEKYNEGVEEGRKAGVEEGRKAGMEEGRKAGVEEGRKEGKLETARQMKADGMAVETIARYTGLPAAEIVTLNV